jgi:ketosteroid isomerase-like protein
MERPLAETIDAYFDAWRRRDVDGIVALHSADSVFRLHVIGEQDATGPDAIRAAFADVFDTWPNLSFHTLRLDLGADFFAHQMDVWGTPRNVLDHADGTLRQAAEPVHYEMLDVIQVREGLITRKDTFVDALAIVAGTSVVEGASR